MIQTSLIESLRQLGDYLGGYVVPPATPEQIAVTETELGYPLPEPLKTYYLQVANGGFGPMYGLFGASGGFASYGSLDGIHTALGHLYATPLDLLFPDDTANTLSVGDRVLSDLADVNADGYEFHPIHFLCLIDQGCGTYIEMHVRTGKIFESLNSSDNLAQVTYLAPSLDIYFRDWLKHVDIHAYKQEYSFIRNSHF